VKEKEKISVGLDIGTQSVKIVKLKLNKDKVELLGSIAEPIAADLTEILKKLKTAQSIDVANISLSGGSTLVRYVTFPKMGPEELKQALKFEAQKHIPFNVSETNIDGYILKNDLPDNKMLVLLAAAKKDLVLSRLKLMEDAGIRVNAIDIDSIALANVFGFNYALPEGSKNAAAALINIGANFTNLNILENGLPRLSRDIHIAGNNFTQKIADSLELDFKAAELLKLNPDKERLNKIVACFESVLSNLCAEIRTSFDYYENQSASTVAKIYLSGGSAKFIGLKDMLANILGIEVEIFDAFKKAGQNSSPEFSVAMGVALHS